MRYNVLKSCAALLCRTQRRVAHMCSSTVSDTANRLRKTRKKKSSVVPLFRSGHMSAICARLGSKGKAGVQRGRKTAGCPSFLPPRRVPRRSRRPQTANPPAEVQRKTPRPSGANTLAQFVSPAQPVLKKLPPVRGEPACGSSCAPADRCRKYIQKELLRNATALSSVNLNRTGSKPKFPRRYARLPR